MPRARVLACATFTALLFSPLLFSPLLFVPGCGQAEAPAPAAPTPAIEPATACPAGPLPSARAPGVTADQETLAHWLARAEPDALDATLVGEPERQFLRAQAEQAAGGPRDPWSVGIDSASTLAQMQLRLGSMRRELDDGTNVEAKPGALAEAERVAAAAESVDHARLVVREAQMFCTPTAVGIHRRPVDEAFDRNLCSTLHPGEIVRVFARADAGAWWLAHAGHTIGWVQGDGLSRRLSEDDRLAWRAAERVYARRDDVRTNNGVALRFGAALPVRAQADAAAEAITVWVASDEGPVEDTIAVADVTLGPAALTRRELLLRAFAAMGDPYGWGGKGGARDCSQFLHDLFAGFGVPLGRHSSVQAAQGTENVDVAGWAEADKLAAIDAAAAKGVVLLYMPGHVMLDVGKDGDGRYAISAIAEYVEPCVDAPAGTVVGETLRRLDRVAVTDLELGRGSSRGAFIERITRIAVFGRLP